MRRSVARKAAWRVLKRAYNSRMPFDVAIVRRPRGRHRRPAAPQVRFQPLSRDLRKGAVPARPRGRSIAARSITTSDSRTTVTRPTAGLPTCKDTDGVARDAGDEMSADEPFRWLATGGFAASEEFERRRRRQEGDRPPVPSASGSPEPDRRLARPGRARGVGRRGLGRGRERPLAAPDRPRSAGGVGRDSPQPRQRGARRPRPLTGGLGEG